jgi:hypothetical protein
MSFILSNERDAGPVELVQAFAGALRQDPACSIRVVLLGAYHDCRIELTYPKVYSYRLGSRDSGAGAGDWRYDEFRLTDDGRVIHEIEWASGPERGANWLIEATDAQFKVVPMPDPRTVRARRLDPR